MSNDRKMSVVQSNVISLISREARGNGSIAAEFDAACMFRPIVRLTHSRLGPKGWFANRCVFGRMPA